MEWERELPGEHYRNFDYLVTVWIFFILFAVIFRNTYIFTGAGILSAYILLYRAYERMIGKKLALANYKTVIKMFAGDDIHWQITVTNDSITPIINGELRLTIGTSVKMKVHDEEMDTIPIPLSLRRNSTSVIEIPVKAIERGVAKVNEITLTYPHLFHFKTVMLVFKKLYQTEFLVYPTPIPVQGMQKVLDMAQGNYHMNMAPFEDILHPRSIRDYQYSDPFSRINWQASLKTGNLQTNEYAKVVQISYVIVLNLQTEDGSDMVRYRERIERWIAYAAYVCSVAAKTDISYSLFVNVRKQAKTPFLHLQEGNGKIHYGQAMELLARIHKQPITIPLKQMLHYMSSQAMHANVMILIGDVTEPSRRLIQQWRNKKVAILHVADTGASPMIKEIG
ncbi:DUF58 domain-containing protein [Virgibacillus sp. 179-BFC.A HS]|uniref:DUF58 domain-containing protein n=1 Tax=Tigheibacillus jepli TaxID=3035914 RepID=A0ABU5CFW7_9BACI|nr:DUF58 domain-containing protein [Virgibacillus sp. 179-BFC.A HS]MDY0405204.1 DUF58 domain-containing protein [Virgibacillus sp. 179-BFC.A HS]